jgi:hypothetical protein
MAWVAVAIAGGALIGGVVTSHAASKAADTQQQATDAGIAEQQREYNLMTEEQKRQYDQTRTDQLGQLAQNRNDVLRQLDLTRSDQAPYRDTGARALGQLETGNNTPLDPASVQMDPGYEFARHQGQQAIDRMAAASGGRLSGAALKAASQYNTDYATTGYSTAYNRQNLARSDRLNRLAALAGIGQTGTQQVGAAGTSATSQLGTSGTSAMNALGQAGTAAANAIGNAGMNSANSISTMLTAQGNASGAAGIAQGNIWGGVGNQLAALYSRNYGGGGVTGGGGFGTGSVYGNQDYGLYL